MATNSSYWFIFQNNHLLVANVNHAAPQLLLTTNAIAEIKPLLLRQHQIAHLNHHLIYCAELAVDQALPAHIVTMTFKKALELLGAEWYNAAAKAYAIMNWDRNHLFCGHCGQPTTTTAQRLERSCPVCELMFYPRISPSMIVLIKKGDDILMARGHHFTPNIYGLIAGFIEPGENIEEAVHREVKEEVGIEIKNLCYFGSQAWPFPDSLMIAFTAEYASGEIIIDVKELAEAGWYHYARLPNYSPSSISISRRLIEHVLVEKQAEKK